MRPSQPSAVWKFRYPLAVAVAVAAILLRWAMAPVLGTGSPYIFAFPALLVIAFRLGLGPGLVAAVVTTFTGQMLLVHPGRLPVTPQDFAHLAIALACVAFVVAAGQRGRSERRRTLDILESTTDACLGVDRQWCVTFSNERAGDLSNLAGGGLVGRTIWDVLPGFAQGERARDLKEVMEMRVPLRVEAESVFHPGQWHALQIVPTDDGVAIFAADVTDRRRMADKLARSQELLEAVTGGTGVIIAALGSDLRYIFFNRPYAEEITRLTGMTLSIGTSMPELFAHMPEQQKAAVEQWTRTLRGETRNYTIEFGEATRYRRVYNVLQTPIRDAAGNVVGAGEVASDVTRQTQAEESLRRQTEIMEGVNRILQEVVTGRTEEDLGRICLAVAESITRSRFGLVAMIGPDGRLDDVAISDPGPAACGPSSEEGVGGLAEGLSLHGVCGRVLTDGKGFFTNDSSSPPVGKGVPEGRPGLTALLGVPLVHDGKTVGVIALANREGGYRQEDLDAMGAISVAAAQALLRRRAEAELVRLNRTLRALSSSSQAIMRAGDEDAYLAEVCRVIVEDCGHAMVWVGYAEDDEAKSVRPVAHAGFDSGYIEALNVSWADCERGHGPTGTAIRTGKPVGCANMLTDPAFAPWREQARSRGYASSVVLPLASDDRVFGALNIYSRRPNSFSAQETALLAELASDLAFGIGAIRLRAAHAQAEEKLRSAHDELELHVRERTAELERRGEQLRAVALELTQAEQRERKRLAGILHDHLQQLLVATKLAAQLLPRQATADDLATAAGHVVGLLDECIKASRSLTIELSPPILHDAGLVAAVGWLGRWMYEKHGLTVEVVSDVEIRPDAEGICVLLFESVRELLFNVVKHAGVKTARVLVACPDGGRVHVTVADDGVGFDPASAGAGTADRGFGLFSIRERLDLLNGQVTLKSAPGRGTSVTLIAPLRPQSAGAPAAEAHPASVGAHGAGPAAASIRVLVADDHAIVRQGITRLLQAEPDIDVVGEASDGQSAFDMARSLRPDVIIMDVNMPGLGGVEVTRLVTSSLRDVRVIGLSMYEAAEMARAMRAAGAFAYLHKAGPPESLITAIRAARASVGDGT